MMFDVWVQSGMVDSLAHEHPIMLEGLGYVRLIYDVFQTTKSHRIYVCSCKCVFKFNPTLTNESLNCSYIVSSSHPKI